MRVGGKRTGGLSVDYHLAKDEPVPVALSQQPDVGLLEPLIHDARRRCYRRPRARELTIGYDAQKSSDRLSRQAYRCSAREDLLRPNTGFGVMGRGCVRGVKKNVGIESDQVCAGPSRSSINSSMSS